MKQTITVIYEEFSHTGIRILKIEGAPLPDGVSQTMPNTSRDEFIIKLHGWRLVWEDEHVMVFEKDS